MLLFPVVIQAGINGSIADPLSLQPSGGSVAIGTVSPETLC
jgi:hypothetical protein